MSTSTDKKYKYIDYLDEDDPISGQKFVCLSFLSPEGVSNCKIRGVKVRGVFSTREEADQHCKKLSKLDPDFDVFVGDVGKWLPWNPDPQDIKDQVYANDELNNLIKKIKQNKENASEAEKQRKRDLKNNAVNEESARRELEKEQKKSSLTDLSKK